MQKISIHVVSWLVWSCDEVFKWHTFGTLHSCWEAASHNLSWASNQIRKIVGCECAGTAGNVFPRRRLQMEPLVSDPCVRDARAMMHVRIVYPQWQGKRSRHSRCMRTRNFTYLARGPWTPKWFIQSNIITGGTNNKINMRKQLIKKYINTI